MVMQPAHMCMHGVPRGGAVGRSRGMQHACQARVAENLLFVVPVICRGCS